MVSGEHSTRYSSGSTPLLTLFRLSTCPMLAHLSRFVPSSRRVSIEISLTHVITPTTQLSRFPFFSIYLGIKHNNSLTLGLSSIPYWELGLTPLKDSIIVKYSEYDLLLFCCLPLILTTLIVCWILLLLIIIILSRPCVSFLLLRSVCLLLVFYLWCQFMPVIFDCQLGGQRKLSVRSPNFLFYYFYLLCILCLPSTPNMESSKVG